MRHFGATDCHEVRYPGTGESYRIPLGDKEFVRRLSARNVEGVGNCNTFVRLRLFVCEAKASSAQLVRSRVYAQPIARMSDKD